MVCDASCLERNLLLALQVSFHCPSVMLCVNLMDEAAKKGIHIDLALLEKLLGFPVSGTAARQRQGLAELSGRLDHLLLEKKQREKDSLPKSSPSLPGSACHSRLLHRLPGHLPRKCGLSKKDRKLDKILTGRYTGFLAMLLLLSLIFWITVTGANYPSSLLSQLFLMLEEGLSHLLSKLQVSPLLSDFLLEGVFRVLSWVGFRHASSYGHFFSSLYPVGGFRIPAENCLQSGLLLSEMPCLRQTGPYHGHGLCCNCVGVLGCRIIDSPRERLIALLTHSFAALQRPFSHPGHLDRPILYRPRRLLLL